jgi:hypothetical protein
MMHPELAISAQPVTQAVAQYRAAVTQISFDADAIAARIYADDQANGAVPAKPSAGEAPVHPSPGPFADTEKGSNISEAKP